MMLNRYLKFLLLILLLFSFASCSLTPKDKIQTSAPWEKVDSEKTETEGASHLNLLSLFFHILWTDLPLKVESKSNNMTLLQLACKNSPLHLHSSLSPPFYI